MKKGQIRTGIVEEVKFPNRAVVRLFAEENGAEGKRSTDAPEGVGEEYCTVKGALPGQKVLLVVTKVRKGKGEGRLKEILEPSPLETSLGGADCCRHFGICGGCSYLSMPYGETLRLKERQVRALLDPVLAGQERECAFEPIKPSPDRFGYRNKMEFSFGDEVKDGPLALGMHRKGSFYDVVTVDDCRIVDGDYRKILIHTLQYFQRENLPFFHRYTHEGYLRHLLVRKASKTGEILIALVTTTQLSADLTPWKEMLLTLPLEGKIAGILQICNDSVADAVKSDETRILYGQDFFYEELLGLKFQISTFSFFQTNSRGAEVLYETAREYIGDLTGEDGKPESVVFDLYSGTGTIAQLMAPVAKKVIGVEIVEEAVEAARENARRNGLDNCEFIAGDVLKVLDTIEDKPDFIILDPPRDGVNPKALSRIIAYGVPRLVYISCKPTSLARDLEIFLENGYEAVRCVPVDMFPWTGNVETVVLLSKGKIDSKKVRLEFSLEDMDMSGFQNDATYGQIKERVLQQTGLKVSSLYIAQVKQKYGIIERENYNKPKSENAKQPKCPPEKEAAITEALKFFGMI